MTTTSKAWKGKVHTDQMRVPEQSETVLGQQVVYPEKYNPKLLQTFERNIDRKKLGITSSNPFVGMDIWNCYEVSFLEKNGMPRALIAKISVPANSPRAVESKSLKLYLNSFNMETFTDVTTVRNTIKEDLSNALDTDVDVRLIPTNATVGGELFLEGICIEDILTVENIDFTYEENDELLKAQKMNADAEERPEVADMREANTSFYTHLLRSNCKVTNQPDWGTAFIHYKGGKKLDPVSFLQYIVSFRKSNHFHEEVCERIYVDLDRVLNPSELIVGCFYTRRGGIDINPIRASHKYLINELFGDLISLSSNILKLPRQ